MQECNEHIDEWKKIDKKKKQWNKGYFIIVKYELSKRDILYVTCIEKMSISWNQLPSKEKEVMKHQTLHFLKFLIRVILQSPK